MFNRCSVEVEKNNTFTNGAGINAALVRIQTVDPYRLPGWVLTSLGLLAALIVLLFFSETRPWTCNMHFPKCYSKNEVQLSLKLNSKMKTYFIVSIFYA